MANKVTVNGREYTPFESIENIKVGDKVILVTPRQIDLKNGYKKGDILTVRDLKTFSDRVITMDSRAVLCHGDLAPYEEPKEETERQGFMGSLANFTGTMEELKDGHRNYVGCVDRLVSEEEEGVTLVPGMQVAVSDISEENAIEELKFDNEEFFYIGKVGKSYMVFWKDEVGDVVPEYYSFCTPVPKQEKEVVRPKYKIGDKMFWDAGGQAFIISTICQDGDEFRYDGLLEESIRPATPEEIELYFN